MSNRFLRTFLSLITGFAVAPAVWVLSPKANVGHSSYGMQKAVVLQAVSGKISSVREGSFTLEVSAAAAPPSKSFLEPRPNTMTFFIDSKTTVDGTLKVGAMADVTFRLDNGNNMAVSVHVSP